MAETQFPQGSQKPTPYPRQAPAPAARGPGASAAAGSKAPAPKGPPIARGVNRYSATVAPAFTKTIPHRKAIEVVFENTNKGNVTLNLNNTGFKAVRSMVNGRAVELRPGAIAAKRISSVMFDGHQYILGAVREPPVVLAAGQKLFQVKFKSGQGQQVVGSTIDVVAALLVKTYGKEYEIESIRQIEPKR